MAIRKRGPTITPEIENLIGSVYREHPKWKAPRIRNVVEGILFEKKAGFPRGWPSLSKVQKVLATIRKNAKNPNPEDKPWSIGTPSSYVVPPEALPIVLSVCKAARDAGNIFTIRQAKWAARLSGVLRGQHPSALWEWTVSYAGAEVISQLLNRPLDTLSLDAQLIGVDPDQWTEENLKLRFQLTGLRLQKQLEKQKQDVRGIPWKEYPPAIWEQENGRGEQSENQSKAKRKKRHTGGKK